MKHIKLYEQFIGEPLNERIDWNKITINGRPMTHPKHKKIYQILNKDTNFSTKRYSYKYLSDYGFSNKPDTYKEKLLIIKKHSDDVVDFRSETTGSYDHNRFIFIKGLGLFSAVESNRAAADGSFKKVLKDHVPAQYHQYFIKK